MCWTFQIPSLNPFSLCSLPLCLPKLYLSLNECITWSLPSDWIWPALSTSRSEEGRRMFQVLIILACLWGPPGLLTEAHCSCSTQPFLLPVPSNHSLSDSSVAITPEFRHSSLWFLFILTRKKREITTKKWQLDWQQILHSNNRSQKTVEQYLKVLREKL